MIKKLEKKEKTTKKKTQKCYFVIRFINKELLFDCFGKSQ